MMASSASRPRFNLRTRGLVNLPISINTIRKASPRRLTELMLQSTRSKHGNLVGYHVETKKVIQPDSRSTNSRASAHDLSTDMPAKSIDANTTFHATRHGNNFYRTKNSLTNRDYSTRLASTGDSYHRSNNTSSNKLVGSIDHVSIRDQATSRINNLRSLKSQPENYYTQNKVSQLVIQTPMKEPKGVTQKSFPKKLRCLTDHSRLSPKNPSKLAKELFTAGEMKRLGHLTNVKSRSAFVKNCHCRLD